MQQADIALQSQGDPLTHLEFLSNTGENTSKKLSFASLLEGTELSKVGSTLLNARLFTGSDNISYAEEKMVRSNYHDSTFFSCEEKKNPLL